MTNEPTPTDSAEKVVAEWRAAMEGVTPGPWSASGRFVSAIGGVDTCAGAVHGTIIACEETWQSDGEGREWSTSGSADRNAAWVARCTPDNIAALLTVIEQTRERAAQWAGDFGRKCYEVESQRATIERVERERDDFESKWIEVVGLAAQAEARVTALEAEATQLVNVLDTMGDAPDALVSPELWRALKCEDAISRAREALSRSSTEAGDA
jgi:hypothetical protein